MVTADRGFARSSAGAGRRNTAVPNPSRGPSKWHGPAAQLEFRYLGIGPAKSHRFQELASNLLYPNPSLRVPGDRLERNRLGQSGLWGYGISGDLPMLTVIIAEPARLPLVRELLLAHTYWRMRGFRADLIILNQEAPSYDRPLHHQLQRQIDAYSRRNQRTIGPAAYFCAIGAISRSTNSICCWPLRAWC